MVERGVPIHGVGYQMHANGYMPNITLMEWQFDVWTELGLEVHITEMDVNCEGCTTARDFENQAEVYRTVLVRFRP